MIFLIFSSLSTLRRGDNPYAILGVAQGANYDEIRKAYRQIVFQHHPDRSKDPDSQNIYIRANDAYELLSNPQRKLLYDETGQVDDIEPEEQQQQHQRGQYNDQYQDKRPFEIPLITEQLFPIIARDGAEWLIYIFQTFQCPQCSEQNNIFERFAYTIKDFIKIAKIDASQAPNLCEQFKINGAPYFLTVQMIDGKYHVQKLGSSFSSVDKLQKAFFSGSLSIKTLTNINSLNSWLKKSPSIPHVIELHTSSSPSISYLFSASRLKFPLFASFKVQNNDSPFNSQLSQWKIKIQHYPCVFIFRSPDRVPEVLYSNGRRLIDDINDAAIPLFPILSSKSFRSILSNDWCIAVVAEENGIPEELLEYANTQPFRTARIQPGSALAKEIHAKKGRWFVFMIDKKSDNCKYWTTRKINNSNSYASICSRLYRAERIEHVLGEAKGKIPIPKESEFSKFITTSLSLFERNLMISYSVVFVILVLFFIIFITKINDKDKIETNDKDKIGTNDKDKIETNNKDKIETNNKDKIETNNKDKIETNNKDKIETNDKDKIETNDKDKIETNDKDKIETNDKDKIETNDKDKNETNDKTNTNVNDNSQDKKNK